MSTPATHEAHHTPHLHTLTHSRPSSSSPRTQVAIKRIFRVFADLIDAKRIVREIKLLMHLEKHANVIEVRQRRAKIALMRTATVTTPPLPPLHRLLI